MAVVIFEIGFVVALVGGFFAGNLLGFYSTRPGPWNWRALFGTGLYFKWLDRQE